MNYFTVDHIVVYFFLLLTLLVGIASGRNIKTVREYAIADKGYSTTFITITILATLFGGGSIFGNVEQIYRSGVLFALPFTGLIIGSFIIGMVIAPRFASGKFHNMLTIGDIMRKYYGRAAEFITALAGLAFTVGILGAQLTAMGYLISTLLQIDHLYAVIASTLIITLYSSFGGIKSVTMTDVIQFAVLVVVVPVFATLLYQRMGGGAAFVDVLSSKLYEFDPKNDMKFFFLFLVNILALGWLDSAMIQRFLMARDAAQVRKSFLSYPTMIILFLPLAFVIGYAGFHLYPDIPPNQVMMTMLHNEVPVFMRGFAVAGMLAVIMSTADSYLNSGSILFVHNFIKPVFPKIKNELLWMKVTTLVIGGLAAIIGLQQLPIVDILLMSDILWGAAVSIPLLFAILDFKVSRNSYFACVVTAIGTYLFFERHNFGIGILSEFMAIVFGTIGFCAVHVMSNQGFKFIPNDNKVTSTDLKQFNILQRVKKPFQVLKEKGLIIFCRDKLERDNVNYMTFAIFCCLNFIVPFFMWTQNPNDNQLQILVIRVMAGILCVGVMIRHEWANRFQNYFALYWYATLMFCLPFITTVMFITEQGSAEWVLNLSLTIVILLSLVDWVSFLIISSLGILLGCLYYTVFIGEIALHNLTFEAKYLALYAVLFSILVGYFFIRRKESSNAEKIGLMESVGGIIAHEMTTPMSVCNMYAHDAKFILEEKLAASTGKKISFSREEIEHIIANTTNIARVSNRGTKTVSMLLTSLKKRKLEYSKVPIKVSTCIKNTVEDFIQQRAYANNENIVVNIVNDFSVMGDEGYFNGVLSNLIKNAFIHGGCDVKVTITIKDNSVLVHDNGKGISRENMYRIFDSFYTTSKDNGTGLGLAFCRKVIESMKGRLEVESIKDQYTTFVISFSDAALTSIKSPAPVSVSFKPITQKA
jgi:Na+/proline symporter/signal transduction histidine kinase